MVLNTVSWCHQSYLISNSLKKRHHYAHTFCTIAGTNHSGRDEAMRATTGYTRTGRKRNTRGFRWTTGRTNHTDSKVVPKQLEEARAENITQRIPKTVMNYRPIPRPEGEAAVNGERSWKQQCYGIRQAYTLMDIRAAMMIKFFVRAEPHNSHNLIILYGKKKKNHSLIRWQLYLQR